MNADDKNSAFSAFSSVPLRPLPRWRVTRFALTRPTKLDRDDSDAKPRVPRARLRALAALAAAFLCGGAAPSSAPPLQLHYEAEALGLPILSLDFRVTERSGDYVIASSIRTVGLLAFFSTLASLTSESRGTLARGIPIPRSYTNETVYDRGGRRTEIDYSEGRVTARITPEKDSVPLAPVLVRGTLDPLSAVLALSHAVAAAGRCAGNAVRVFDGRRLYDLVVSEALTPPLAGSAEQRCTVTGVLIFEPKDWGAHVASDHGEVWLARPRPDAEPLPVRAELDSWWGRVILRISNGAS